MELYQIFKIGFYVCLALAILLFVLAIVLFFLLDIRSIHKSRAGREKAKTIREMEQDAAASGRLVKKKPAPRKTGELGDRKLVITKGTVLSPDEADGSAVTAEIDSSEKTAVLGGDAAQTSVLGAEKAETSVLDAPTQRFGEMETSVLVQAANIPAVEGVRFDIVKKIICCDSKETA